MHTDSAFKIGSTHKVCEDYAISGIKDICGVNVAYAIISDGCSSSQDTDFGSRILAKSAEKNIHLLSNGFELGVMNYASTYLDLFEGRTSALDATLNIVYYNGTDVIFKCFGDGAMACIYEDKIDFYEVIAPSGAPNYLSYLLDDNRKKHFIEKFGNDIIIKKNGEVIFDKSPVSVSIKPEMNGLKIALVMSDGISSFCDKNNSLISPLDIFKELGAFKMFQGEFLGRRLNGFEKYCRTNEIKHVDDLSIAGIVL